MGTKNVYQKTIRMRLLIDTTLYTQIRFNNWTNWNAWMTDKGER